MKRTPTDHPSRDQGEEPFDLIQPRATGWREVELETLPLLGLESTLHLDALMRAVVVHDQVHLLIGREMFFQMIEKADKFAAPVALLTGPNHFAVENVERGE